MIAIFKKQKKKILTTTLLGMLITFISLAIVGTQLFYPYHTLIGISIFICSFIPFGYRIYLSKKSWKQFKTFTFSQKFFKREKRKIIISLVIMLGLLTFLTVRPFGENPFKGLNEADLKAQIVDDMFKASGAMDYLESTGNTLIETLKTDKTDTYTTEVIKHDFSEFITAVMFSESLTDVHRLFDRIPYRYEDERSASFIISYSLYIKKYELLHRIFSTVGNNEYQNKILNEFVPTIGQDKVYAEMLERFYLPKTRLRINAGRLYLSISHNANINSFDGEYGVLKLKSEESYKYLFSNFGSTLVGSFSVASEAARSRMFDSWFPIQKGIASNIGHIILTSRGHKGLISEDQLDEMEKHLRPGDIILQRRNWHLTNVGIPGFWTHAALYTGSLKEMDTYFKSEFPFEGYPNASSYVEANYPDVWNNNLNKGEIDPYTVIEAMEPGVILHTLKESGNADFLVTLRPNINKRDVMKAVFRAFSQAGKPYDFNFDFDTKDALVCSELIYDAYYENLPEKEGLTLDTSTVNGRPVVTPIDIAKKYKNERGKLDAELSFVYLIAGDEETKNAKVSDEATFLKSTEWSKFTFKQEEKVF